MTVRIPAHHAVTKRLGHWTTERDFEVRAHRGNAVLDLRSPRIPEGDVRVGGRVVRKAAHRLAAGDLVEVDLPDPEPSTLEPEDISIITNTD